MLVANTAISWVVLMWAGLIVTLKLTVITTAIVIVMALLLAAGTICPNRILRFLSRAYCDVFRSIPILAMMLVVYFGFGPTAGRLGISAFWMAVGALSLVESAYLAEIYRGTLSAVPQSQWSAGSSIGLRWPKTAALIIIPQALPAMIPTTANMVIYIIKDSALASLVTVNEVTLVASSIIATTFEPMQVYLVLGCVYLAVIIPLTICTHFIERRFAR